MQGIGTFGTIGLFRKLVLAYAIIFLAIAVPARAAERVALVVGNSAYASLPRLINPTNDAAEIARSLERLGFGVTVLQDANYDQFRLALRNFGDLAARAEIAIVYYAGHGIEVAGENWLVPVDGQLRDDADIGTEGISLRTAMLTVSEAKTLGLVILDACRNDPFERSRKTTAATRSVSRGLAPVEPGENVLVAYAARDGTTARDGEGRNSPYTKALLRHLETPGLELEFLFRNVRDDVWSATNGAQQPFLYGSLSKDEIYLNTAAKHDPSTVTAAIDQNEIAQAADIAWSFVQVTSDVDTLRRFTERFPASNQVGLARQRIAVLQTASQSDAPPIGAFSMASDEAVTVSLDEQTIKTSRPFRRTTPAVELAWNVVKESKDVSVVRRFTDHFPSARRRAEVVARMDQFFFTAPDGARATIGSARPLTTRDVMLQAAQDEDVLRCFQLNDIYAPQCRNALERYPLIARYTYDYRFRFTLCQALGDACSGRRDMLASGANLQSNALFNPQNTDVTRLSAVPAGPGSSGASSATATPNTSSAGSTATPA